MQRVGVFAMASIQGSSSLAPTRSGRVHGPSPNVMVGRIHTHALEQADETEAVRHLKGGRDEIEYFDDEGILDTDLRIAHGVWLNEQHRAQVGRRRFSVIHCPSSNLKLGSGVADVVALRQSGIPVGLGCDGTACCNHFDAFEEMRLAALLQKTKHDPGAFSGGDALALATREGAPSCGAGS